MPDISIKGSHQFWNEYRDPAIYRVVSFMEGVETWTLDGDSDFEDKMDKLSNLMDGIDGIELLDEENFIKLLTYVKAARMLRIMQVLDSANPGSASKILIHAEKNTQSSDDIMGLFLRRNIVFERLRLLGRIFAKERLDLIQKAIEEASSNE